MLRNAVRKAPAKTASIVEPCNKMQFRMQQDV